jgi:predicted ribonuclease YlaK
MEGERMQGLQKKWLEERGITIDKYKDPYQADYADKLFDPSVEAIFGIGKAGTGKTTLAALVGIYLVEKQEYSKLIYLRSPHTVGKELGFLEGGLTTKQAPYMKPFYECLDLARINGDAWIKFNKLVLTTPTYERGVNFDGAYVICDEFQSWELIEAQTILTRKKDNCKIIMTGSLNQNDNPRNQISGKTPFEWYMDHFRPDFPKVQICPLIKGYRGWFADKADTISETINSI